MGGSSGGRAGSAYLREGSSFMRFEAAPSGGGGLKFWVGAKYFRRVAKEGAKKDISQLRGAPPSWT